MRAAKRLVLAALALAACGGKKGTVTLDIVVSPVDDPFLSATEARFTIGTEVKSVPVTGGHFDFQLEEGPPKNPTPIIVDGLDAAGNVVAHGETPPLALSPIDQGPYSIWVGRPGTIAAARAELPSPRAELAALGATGFGALFIGGRNVAGEATADLSVYSVYNQTVVSSESMALKPMSTPRAGAAAIAAPPRGIVFGGAQAPGFGAAGGAQASAELYDPSGQLWAAVPADTAPEARSRATTITLGSGSGLVTGGLNGSGDRVGTGVLVSTGGTARITPLMMPMVSPRARHAAAPARFPDGDGALLVGGLGDGDLGPHVERLIGQSFTTFDAAGVENRWDATATGIAGGVLVVGGTIDDGAGTRVATSSIVFIPTETLGAPTRYDTLLPIARAGHTATKLGDDLLVCGGVDANGVPLASCDLLGTNPVAWKRTVPAATGRTGHVAVALETGPILLVGGVGLGGVALSSIEIYTP